MGTQVDNQLMEWKSYLANISSNLIELSEHTEFQLVKSKARSSENGYTGITKVKADKCVESEAKLWRHFSQLSEVIKKAEAINSRQSLLYNPEEDVRKLLETTMIVIDTQHVDINDRNLISGQSNEKKATPRELLKNMQDAFEVLCDDVEEISKAEDALHVRLKDIKNEIKRLNSVVKGLGIMDAPSFDTTSIENIENDPLKGITELDNLVYCIEKYRASIKGIEDEYNGVSRSLENSRSILEELKELAFKSNTAINETKRIFGLHSAGKPVIGQEVLESLQDWLRLLESKLAEGSIKAAGVGAAKLEKECLAKLERERQNYEENSRDYNEWLDLKGQFKALLAKAEALRARGLLMVDSLDEITEKTYAVLYANPVNLDSCRQMIKKFESCL